MQKHALEYAAGDTFIMRIGETGYRLRWCKVLARLGEEILVEYVLRSTTALRLVNLYMLSLNKSGVEHEDYTMYNETGRAIEYHRVSLRWLDAIVEQKQEWYGCSKGKGKLPDVWLYAKQIRIQQEYARERNAWEREQARKRTNGQIWETTFPGYAVVEARKTKTPISLSRLFPYCKPEEVLSALDALFEEDKTKS